MRLLIKTLIAFLLGLLITGAMLFLPAGTLAYRGAWLFIALLFTPILIMGVVLFIKNPELLRKRLEMKERENVYLSRVVEVQAEQRVIDTGLYGIVRHPMYFAVTLLYLAIPLVLGSWWALLVMSPCVGLLAARIKNEEQVLRQGLPGYADYTKRVRYRMIPWIW